MPFTIEQLRLRVQEVKIKCAGEEVQTYELNLSGEHIDKDTMKNIKEVLEKNPKITSLNFSSCTGLSDPHTACLIPSLLSSTVKYLNFENTKVEWFAGDAGKEMFAKRNLRKIILKNAGINDWFINQHTMWSEYLVRSQVQDLDLRNNQITEDGAKKLEDRLWGCEHPNTALTHLQVGGNQMDPNVIKRLEERTQFQLSPYWRKLEAEQQEKKKATERVQELIAKYTPKKQQIIDFFSAFWFEQLSQTTITLNDIETLTKSRVAAQVHTAGVACEQNITKANEADILPLSGNLIENADVATLKTFLQTFLEDLNKARYDDIHLKDRIKDKSFMNLLYEESYNFFDPIGKKMHENAEARYKLTLKPPVYAVDSPLPGYEGEVKSRAEDAVVVHQQVPARLPEETDGSVEIKLTAETVSKTIDTLWDNAQDLDAFYQALSAGNMTELDHRNDIRVLSQTMLAKQLDTAPTVFGTRKEFDKWLSDACELIEEQCKKLYGTSGVRFHLVQAINLKLVQELNPAPIPAPVVAFHPRPSESLADRAEKERKLKEAIEVERSQQQNVEALRALLANAERELQKAQAKVQKRRGKMVS